MVSFIELEIKTKKREEFRDITADVRKAVQSSEIKDGIAIIFVPHTTAGVIINESYDPDVVSDLNISLQEIVPYEKGYKHSEGNSPAHIKSTLVGNSQIIPIENGEILLGTWQGIFFCEFDGPRTRQVYIKFLKGA